MAKGLISDIVLPGITIATVHILATIRPGANFLLSARYGLSSSRGIALKLTAGIASGCVIFVLLGLFGISAIIAQRRWIMQCVRYVGFLYFLGLGARSLMRVYDGKGMAEIAEDDVHPDSGSHAFIVGLFSMLLNPMAGLHFLLLFSVLIPPNAHRELIIVIAILLPLITWIWFSTVAMTFAIEKVRSEYIKRKVSTEILYGLAMTMIAVYFIVSDF
jgi:threonine efflux protein